MTLMEGLVVASGLAIGYWLVSVFTRSADDYDDTPAGNADAPEAAAPGAPWDPVELGV